MIGISRNIEAINERQEDNLTVLSFHNIFNYYLYNLSTENSSTPVAGTLTGESLFNTSCHFNTSGCYNNSFVQTEQNYVEFTIDKDLRAIANSTNTNLTLFWCAKIGSNEFKSLLDSQSSDLRSGMQIYYSSTTGQLVANNFWGDGQSVSASALIEDVDSNNVLFAPHCVTVIVNSTGRSIELYFNNTLNASGNANSAQSTNSIADTLSIGRQKDQASSRHFFGEFELLTIYNFTANEGQRKFLWNNGNPFIVSLKDATIPDITLNSIATTHNRTIIFNFTIDDPNNDAVNYTLWADTNLTPDTNINQTLNVTGGTFIFNYTFGIAINGSINGTYYWKVNGTDNNSNNFESLISTFNITNNISLYNVTNVSITPLPLSVGTEAKCHFNITTREGQLEDIISISDQRWWLNGSLVAEAGNKTLSAGNVTVDSNITCEVRVNNGYGETAWTEYVNSSQVTGGDTTNPILNNCTLSSNSITDASGNTINLTCDATDASSNIQTIVASLNGTINKTLTFSFTQSQNVIATRTIFQSEETLLIGSYSISQVNVTDTSSNKLSNTTKDLHFTVTSAPSGNGGTSGGGGGGGLQTIIVEKNETIITGQCNFNGVCEPQFGEDSFNCGVRIEGDCEPKFEEILPTCLLDKNQQCLWRTAIVGRIALIALIVSFLVLISDTSQGRKVRKVLKERLNINLLKE